MSDVIADYQKWKEQGENLRSQARQAMEMRFRELLAEAVQIAEEYRSDFGSSLKPPLPVTAFRYKASGRAKRKRPAPSKPEKRPQHAESRVAAPAKPPSKAEAKKTAALEKRLAAARKKLEDAKAAGSPTRTLEDRIYEIEDAIRLGTQMA